MMFESNDHFEHESQTENKPQFEAGFNRGNDIIVNITKHIDSLNIVLLIATMDEWIDKFYSSASETTGCKVICLFNAYGEDFSCVTTFYNYIKSVLEKRPKVSFTGVLEYAEGNVALMFMLMHERLAKPNGHTQTQTGLTQIGQSALLFNVIQPQFKNDIAKYLFDNKIEKKVIPLCFPPDDKSRIQYCGDTISDSGFAQMPSDDSN